MYGKAQPARNVGCFAVTPTRRAYMQSNDAQVETDVHLTADANRVVASERELDLVVNFETLER